MYTNFQTDRSLEETGIWLDYGPFRVKIARSGGSNKSFARKLEAKTRPYQRAIKTETMDPAIAERLMREVFAEAVILDWNIKDAEGKWIVGMELPNGEIGKPNVETIIAILEEVPELFSDIQEQANKAANFREALRDANAGN